MSSQQGKEANAPLMRENEEAIHVQESKRRKRRIMKVAVYMMFGLIVIGVFTVWLFHKDTNDSIAMGPQFKFTVKARTLEIQNSVGDSVLYADLGTRLKATPYEQCWNDKINEYEINCIDWRKLAKVNFLKNEGLTNSCYSIVWTSLSEDLEAEDCFYIQTYNWFGYLSNQHKTWPIQNVRMYNLSYYPKYPDKFEHNIVPYWLSSAGVSIVVNNNIPFSVSWNISAQRQLCISATKNYNIRDKPVLRYTICQAEDMHQVYYRTKEYLEKFFSKTPVNSEVNGITRNPIFYVSHISELDSVQGKITPSTKCSYLELFSNWENEFGDLLFKPDVLGKLQNLQATLNIYDCKFMIPISAFFAFNSKNFNVGITNKFFVRDEMNLVSKLLNWDGFEGAILDMTNPNATLWYTNYLLNLLDIINIGAFKLLHVDIPTLISFQDKNTSVLDYPKLFSKIVASLNITIVLENIAGFMVNKVHVPVKSFVNTTKEPRCFGDIIPYTLLLGLQGNSLIIADGGMLADFDISEELLTLWLQLVIFYPGIRLPFLPILEETNMQRRYQSLMTLRNKIVIPYLEELLEFQESDPLIRPLWWLEPDDNIAQTINDEFLVGDKILVTPIVCEGVKNRKVYLPKGRWKAPSGTISEGRNWVVYIHDIEQVPYYTLVD